MTQGKRAGSRPKPQVNPALLLLALGVTASVVAWGYLVLAAIDFGTDARAGNGSAWWFLLMAALGAVMCLFLGLILVARVGRALRGPDRLDQRGDRPDGHDADPPGSGSGGRRAAR